MAFYDGRGLRAFHDSEPASESLLAEFLTSHPIKVRFICACVSFVAVHVLVMCASNAVNFGLHNETCRRTIWSATFDMLQEEKSS